MTSLPRGSFVGSASTGQSVRDAITSYRRAQYLVAGSTVASVSDGSDPVGDEEAGWNEGDDEEIFDDEEDDAVTPHARQDDFISQFDWDEPSEAMGQPSMTEGSSPTTPLAMPFTRRDQRLTVPGSPSRRVGENTPLLRKVSFSTAPHPHRTPQPVGLDAGSLSPEELPRHPARPILRRGSSNSLAAKSIKHGGQSTFGQTLFNSIAILLGIGMLSEPLAFSYAGWGAGTVLIVFYGFISCYTAKILARIILSDPRLRSYADIGRKAFGPWSTFFISVMFCLELFAVSVILVTLYGDSLHSILPQYSSNTYKVWGLFLLIPTVFLPLSLLSYTSVLGILSTLTMVVVILIDGTWKKEAPGSLWSPAPTSLGIDNWQNLGIAFGLFMAGFSGHAVIPSLARDMADPSEFDRMINWAFLVATSIYALIGAVGYLMFGNSVSEEISMDLLRTPGYNVVLNQAALWMLVASPLSKFALTTQPLNATIEILLGIDNPLSSPEDVADKLAAPFSWRNLTVKETLKNLQRVVVTVLSVVVSVYVPDFSSMMAFLGSFSAFLLCVIGPIGAKVAIAGRCGLFDGAVLFIAVVMAVWGTGAAFMSA